MMEMEQAAGSCPAPDQAAGRTWPSSSTKDPPTIKMETGISGATRTPTDVDSRFHGDGVRYKAKLIGMDPVSDAHGDKMCWDSMMKLKGIEAAARKQGKHKQRVWLKVSSSGLKLVDERTGAVLHDHERSRISSLTKDESDPRALAYIYQQQDTYSLFYIKMANLADPVLVDIKEVCQRVDQETPEDAAETPTQNSALLLLDESSALPPEAPAYEHVFSPRPDSSSGQTKQASSSNELMEVFSIQVEEPTQSVCTSQPESPQPTLSNSQILSMFHTQPVGGSPYSSPTYSPTAMPWGQQGLLGTQWPGPMCAAPWPTMPASMAAWAAAGVAVPPAGSQIQAHSSQPGVMMGGNTIDYPAVPTAVNGYPTPLNPPYTLHGATATLQSMCPSVDHNPLQ